MANGNSSAARRARVKLQLRDRHGKWIEMGAKVRWFGNGSERVGEVTGFEPGGRYAQVTYRGPSGQPITAKVASNQLDVMDVKASLPSKPNNVVDAPKAKLDINSIDPNNFNYLENPSVQRYGRIIADDGTRYRWEKNAWRQEGDLKPTPTTLLAQKHKTFFEDNPEPKARQKAGKLAKPGTGKVLMGYPSIADIRFAPEGAEAHDLNGAKYIKQADGTWVGEPNENIQPLGNGQPLTDEKLGTFVKDLSYPSSVLKPDNDLPDNKSNDDDSADSALPDVDESDTDVDAAAPDGDVDGADSDSDTDSDADVDAAAPDTDKPEDGDDESDNAEPFIPASDHDGDDSHDVSPDAGMPNAPDTDNDKDAETGADKVKPDVDEHDTHAHAHKNDQSENEQASEDTDETDDSSSAADSEEIDALKKQIADAKEEEDTLKEIGADKAEIQAVQKERWALEDKLQELLGKNTPAVDEQAESPSPTVEDVPSSSAESIDIDDIDGLEDGDVVQLSGTMNGEDDITSFTKDSGSWVGTNGDVEVDLDDQALKDYIASVDPQDVTVSRGGVNQGTDTSGEAPEVPGEAPDASEGDDWGGLDEIRSRRDEIASATAEADAARARAESAIAALEGDTPDTAEERAGQTEAGSAVEDALNDAPESSIARLERADDSGSIDVVKNEDGAWVEFEPGEDVTDEELNDRVPIDPASGEYDLEQSEITEMPTAGEAPETDEVVEPLPAPESETAPAGPVPAETDEAELPPVEDEQITDPTAITEATPGTHVEVADADDPASSTVYTKDEPADGEDGSAQTWTNDETGEKVTSGELEEDVESEDRAVSRSGGVPAGEADGTAPVPVVEAETGVPSEPVTGPAQGESAELPAGVADNGGLLPQDGVVSVTDDGVKYVSDANGAALFEGDSVVSRTDGMAGFVEKIEGNGKYVKVRGADGKLYGRRLTTLDKYEPSTTQPGTHSPGIQTDFEGGSFVWSAEDNDPIYVGVRVRERDTEYEGVVSGWSDDGESLKITSDDGTEYGVASANVDVVVNVEIDLGPDAV